MTTEVRRDQKARKEERRRAERRMGERRVADRRAAEAAREAGKVVECDYEALWL